MRRDRRDGASQVPRRRVVMLATVIVILVQQMAVMCAATDRGAAAGLGHLGRSVVPAGLPRRPTSWSPLFPFPRTAFHARPPGCCSARSSASPLGWSPATVQRLSSALLLVCAPRGWQLSHLVKHPRVDVLDARLRERGWPAILSMADDSCGAVLRAQLRGGRPPRCGCCPTRSRRSSACCPAPPPSSSSVMRSRENISPLLFLVSLCTASLGVAGMVYEIRHTPPPPQGAHVGAGLPYERKPSRPSRP